MFQNTNFHSYLFLKDQGVPGHYAFCLTPVGIFFVYTTPKSDVCQCSAMPDMPIQIKVKFLM